MVTPITLSQKKSCFPQEDTPKGFFFYQDKHSFNSFFSPAFLTLQNGTRIFGALSTWAPVSVTGEIVFTTGMTGYVETLTDPSYAGQIITFTYPLIGNYGVPQKKDWEHTSIAACGVIISEACVFPSHYQSRQSLIDWLRSKQVPLFLCSDTRALTKIIREQGTLVGCIQRTSSQEESPLPLFDPSENLIRQVSVKKEKTYGTGKKTIIAVDCGMKENIIREFSAYDVTLIRVPYTFDYTQRPYDGVFISNGPGDPLQATETVAILRKALMRKKPIFGICLGSQLMGLATGAKTYKLSYGHRGQNQPCKELESGKLFLTSQNHGYAVDEKSLSAEWRVTFRNLNDSSVEGIAHTKLPFFSVQFHPEASPGPTDTRFLFENFIRTL